MNILSKRHGYVKDNKKNSSNVAKSGSTKDNVITMTNRSEIIEGHVSMFGFQERKLSPKIVELIFCYSLGESL